MSRELPPVAVADPSSLDAALVGAGIVINCAGPFFDTSLPVIDAALWARISYIDVTAEQAVILEERLPGRDHLIPGERNDSSPR
ncbi:MAG: saccharopine dehydrogenase NADP-binding domain-containing protein [Acidobacteria bacterium]|nr:saccharopine dehydrogenase NADP-binding domain-containing protein [Acidobacteriota bacterium]